MKVITLLNEKGGVGKTTQAIHLASGLAIRGYRVLLIDTDAQANATSQLRCKEHGGLYQLLVKDAEWRSLLQVPKRRTWGEGDKGTLWVLDSNIETRAIPLLVDDVRTLQERLEDIADYVDVCVIDTSPTPSLLHAMIYLASDYMIYPTQAEILSLTGLGKSIAHMKRMQSTRKAFALEPTQLLGVQPVMYQANTVAHQHGLRLIKHKFNDVAWSPIDQRTVWREAAFAQQTLFAYAPEHEATGQAWNMVDNVIEEVSNHE